MSGFLASCAISYLFGFIGWHIPLFLLSHFLYWFICDYLLITSMQVNLF